MYGLSHPFVFESASIVCTSCVTYLQYAELSVHVFNWRCLSPSCIYKNRDYLIVITIFHGNMQELCPSFVKQIAQVLTSLIN